MPLRPFLSIPTDIREWSRWCREQAVPLTIVGVSDTAHTAVKNTAMIVDDDTAGGAVTITLPRVENGIRVEVKKTGTTGSVTIDGYSSETIDGAATLVLSTQWDFAALASDGTGWFVV